MCVVSFATLGDEIEVIKKYFVTHPKQKIQNSTKKKYWGTRWRSWLRHCATSRRVAGSIPDGVIENFHWHNPSGRTMALETTQPLTEMSTRNISWGVETAGALGWPYHLHVPTVLKSGSLNLLEPSGSVQACNGIAFITHKHQLWGSRLMRPERKVHNLQTVWSLPTPPCTLPWRDAKFLLP